jgi:hypothetical protein
MARPPRIVIKGSTVRIPPGFEFKKLRGGRVAIQRSAKKGRVTVIVVCICDKKGGCMPVISGAVMTCKSEQGNACTGTCTAYAIVIQTPDIEVLTPGGPVEA